MSGNARPVRVLRATRTVNPRKVNACRRASRTRVFATLSLRPSAGSCSATIARTWLACARQRITTASAVPDAPGLQTLLQPLRAPGRVDGLPVEVREQRGDDAPNAKGNFAFDRTLRYR